MVSKFNCSSLIIINCLHKLVTYSFLDYNDKLYEKSSGSIVNLSNNEYIYLTFSDWKVSTIKIVYNKNDKEIVYDVFDKV